MVAVDYDLGMTKKISSQDNYVYSVTCKHFGISETESYVEFSTEMSESQYDKITRKKASSTITS